MPNCDEEPFVPSKGCRREEDLCNLNPGHKKEEPGTKGTQPGTAGQKGNNGRQQWKGRQQFDAIRWWHEAEGVVSRTSTQPGSDPGLGMTGYLLRIRNKVQVSKLYLWVFKYLKIVIMISKVSWLYVDEIKGVCLLLKVGQVPYLFWPFWWRFEVQLNIYATKLLVFPAKM